MSDTAKGLFAKGDAAFKRGQWRAALRAFGGVAVASPSNLRARLRVADSLLNTGRRDLAVEVYKAIASNAVQTGQPLLALVATKMVLLLEPDHEDGLVALAEIYGRDSARVDALTNEAPLQSLGDEPAAALGDDEEAVPMAAARAAGGTTGVPDAARVPSVPLLSRLDADAFLAVLGKLQLRRFADEEVIIREGERGESFFLIADGEVLVKRDIDDEDGGVTLAHLYRGAVFGELALISDEPRQASVVARGDVDVLELRRSDLIVAAAHTDGVSDALKGFTRERFLRNLTATHPFFSGLTRDERHSVMECFRVVTFPAGQELIREGQFGPGLFLLLGGSASVSKVSGGERIHLATLRGADVCGEMSLVGDQPTQAWVTADEDLEALFLARDDFKAVVREHPELMKYLASLTDERLRQNRAIMNARGLLEDDEHVMI
ncbi:MAG: cyclic nucleotide-binding domain-containing protein [Deltaproteobacteria bacterium]|nr:cyclic nucleotide-binding domain-containing protein [Deltaproteobacteria bacterium]